MGNIATFEQLPSPLRNLNEDNMVVLLQYLHVSDYVHLMSTCRKFNNETLGPNNYYWAQLINRPAPFPSRSAQYSLVNHILTTTRNGRKFIVDGQPIDLNMAIDTRNKRLVSHFDFRKHIKEYYLKAKCSKTLRKLLKPFTKGTNGKLSPEIKIVENIQLDKFFCKSDPLERSTMADATFVVDLGVDATSLEKLNNMQLPATFKSRRIVYKLSNKQAQREEFKFLSRAWSEMVPDKPKFGKNMQWNRKHVPK